MVLQVAGRHLGAASIMHTYEQNAELVNTYRTSGAGTLGNSARRSHRDT